MNKFRIVFCYLVLFLMSGWVVGCQDGQRGDVAETAVSPPTVQPTAVPTVVEVEETAVPLQPSATPLSTTEAQAPLKELMICMNQEPESLDLYVDQSYSAVSIRHALYENLYTTLDYGYQPQGLEKLPSFADGDAIITEVEVQLGDKIVDVNDNVVRLEKGVTVINAVGEAVVYDGEPLFMNQLTANFMMEPMMWSDGTAVTAQDSVYSYELAADSPFSGDTYKVERTASYAATNTLSMRWTGIPGYLPKDYAIHVWTPLPAHRSIDDHAYLSSGPFVFVGWTRGDSIALEKNVHYYRVHEGLPKLDRITIRFISDITVTIAQLLSGSCDIVTNNLMGVGHVPSLPLVELDQLMELHLAAGNRWEHINFGVNPIDAYAETRPDWFEDVRVRRAMTMCLDRQLMVDLLMGNMVDIYHAYVPENHPLYPVDLMEWEYDVAVANALLDEVGYLDKDGDGIREDPESERPFSVTLGTADGFEMQLQLIQIAKESWRDCGIDVVLYQKSADVWYAESSESPLFGRQFDLGENSWLTGFDPLCHYWMSENITGLEDGGFGDWTGENVTGWSNPEFDAACKLAQELLPGTEEYRLAHQEALRIFADELPTIPLFPQLKIRMTRSEVLNFKLNTTQFSDLWNLYEIDIEE